MAEFAQTAMIAVVDMEGSTSFRDMNKRHARKAMYAGLKEALGTAWSACAHEDRGDGVLMLWPQSVPNPVPPPVIVAGLLGLPRVLPDGPRLRVAIHTGQVFRDERGFVGRSVDMTFRLNEAGVLKTALAQARGLVAYLLSDVVHDSVIEYGYTEFEPSSYHLVPVQAKELTLNAWLHIPGADGVAARVAVRPETPPPPTDDRPGPGPTQTNGVHFHIGGDARFSGPIAGKDLHQ